MICDLAIIGGGINGCGIARDAAGRGLSVVLFERDDLASGTSSTSTKLLHGGLRYLESGDIRLVRESLRERETLLRAMPHIAWPMRFVIPIASRRGQEKQSVDDHLRISVDNNATAGTDTAADTSAAATTNAADTSTTTADTSAAATTNAADTSTSTATTTDADTYTATSVVHSDRAAGAAGAEGAEGVAVANRVARNGKTRQRPAWLIRVGLMLYDSLGGNSCLPPTKTLNLTNHPTGKPLLQGYRKAFEYSDCWVDDSRLVILNARDAANQGAQIFTRHEVISVVHQRDKWQLSVRDLVTNQVREFQAKCVVNAAGAWRSTIGITGEADNFDAPLPRLVRGSHLIVRRLFDHDQPYLLTQPDGRVVFAIPYEQDFTLVGTTDCEHLGDLATVECTPPERRYLLSAINRYFARRCSDDDIVSTFAGVRALVDDGKASPSVVTRDYHLEVVRCSGGGVLLTTHGGKITTYRKLAQKAVDLLANDLRATSGAWTANTTLPGGDFAVEEFESKIEELQVQFPFLSQRVITRLMRCYGTDTPAVLGNASALSDLGKDFGHGLFEREVLWLIKAEWARSAEDILWRRTKLGLRFSNAQTAELDNWLSSYIASTNQV